MHNDSQLISTKVESLQRARMEVLWKNQDEKKFLLDEQHEDDYSDNILAPNLCLN